MDLSEKLIQLRKKKGLSQAELVRMMDVSRQAVAKWEKGAATPTAENLARLSNIYGVPLSTLLDDEKELGEDAALAPEEQVPHTASSKTKIAIILATTVLLILATSFAASKAAESGDQRHQAKEQIEDLERGEIEPDRELNYS